MKINTFKVLFWFFVLFANNFLKIKNNIIKIKFKINTEELLLGIVILSFFSLIF